jgi:hypothetical protein
MGFSWNVIIYNVPVGFAPATVASPDMISMEIRINLNIRYSCKIGFSPEPLFLFFPSGIKKDCV